MKKVSAALFLTLCSSLVCQAADGTNTTAFRLLSRTLGDVEHAAEIYYSKIQEYQPADAFGMTNSSPALSTIYLSWNGYFLVPPGTARPRFDVEPTAELLRGGTSVICFNAEILATNLAFHAEVFGTNKTGSVTALEVRTRVPVDPAMPPVQHNKALRILDAIVAILEQKK